MKQFSPTRNSPQRVNLIRLGMIPILLRRRQILRRIATGGAVFWTFRAQLDSRPAWPSPRPRLPLVMIDPGHGGHDPGATGTIGTLEKDVTLASAQILKAALAGSGRYRAELTRTEDLYVPREERVDIARDLGAHLFLSMHADQLSDPSVRGASVYTLAKAASDAETEALAERENGTVPGAGGPLEHVAPEVSGILASLAARETRAASARMAHQLVRDMERRLPVLPSPERHANFTVLHAAGIPSVLIEMGFLSNPADEAALNDPDHRQIIAHAITRAVDAWFGVSNNDGLL
jgi:N-acetylmuramoyl-L-alanine amidase